ncbi:hypothetical protein B0H14DRAFT_3874961 [Mycena olivaceomarginata]|nr:hypothetical protein B0H14DRAFT_3874961 [Mycena olivaceomarginata]
MGTRNWLAALRSRIAGSIYFVLFGVFHNGIHESVCTAIHAALSHPGVFPSHGVVPVTRLRLGARLHNRRSAFYTSSQHEDLGTHANDLPQRHRPFPCRASPVDANGAGTNVCDDVHALDIVPFQTGNWWLAAHKGAVILVCAADALSTLDEAEAAFTNALQALSTASNTSVASFRLSAAAITIPDRLRDSL